MHHREDLVPAERRLHRRGVQDVSLDELAELHGGAVPRRQVVVDDDAIAGAAERFRRMAADVAGASGDQDGAASFAEASLPKRVSVQWRCK